MVTRSSMSFWPSRVPPPAAASQLRPSSALRASKPIMFWISSTDASGSRITVYLPGSMARGLRLATAFSRAMALADLASNFRTSLASRVT